MDQPLSRSSFYLHRRKLLDHGIDIARKCNVHILRYRWDQIRQRLFDRVGRGWNTQRTPTFPEHSCHKRPTTGTIIGNIGLLMGNYCGIDRVLMRN